MRRFYAGFVDVLAKGSKVLEAGKDKEMCSSFDPPERYMVFNLPGF